MPMIDVVFNTIISDLILAQTKEIQTGNLSKKQIAIFVETLKFNSSLEKLDLSGQPLDNEDIKKLSDALKKNTTLKTLILSNTGISDTGVVILAEGIKGNMGLRELVLQENKISVTGLEALKDALQTNKGIKKVDFIRKSDFDDLTSLKNGNTFKSEIEKIVNDNQKYLAQAVVGLTKMLGLNIDLGFVLGDYLSAEDKGRIAKVSRSTVATAHGFTDSSVETAEDKWSHYEKQRRQNAKKDEGHKK